MFKNYKFLNTIFLLIFVIMFFFILSNDEKKISNLKSNEKIIGVTYKNNDIWFLTEDTITHVIHLREKLYNNEIDFKPIK